MVPKGSIGETPELSMTDQDLMVLAVKLANQCKPEIPNRTPALVS